MRDWVHRYNADGLEGLCDRRSAGPAPRLSPEQKAELAQMVREGPDPAVDGVVRWRRVDLKRKIEARFGVVMQERTVGKQLAALGFRRLSVRPQRPGSDPRRPGSVQKNFAATVADALPESARDKPLEIWFPFAALRVKTKRGWARRGR